MKKVLIVIPGCRTGGVLSSLIALLNSNFIKRYNVQIFIMNSFGEEIPPELKMYSIGMNIGTSLIYANVTNYGGILKYILILFKLLLHTPLIGGCVRDWIETSTIRNLERRKYDCVISFQESASLPFVAKFSNNLKIAWIHCDYSRLFTNKENEISLFSQYSKIVTVSQYTKKVFCQLIPSLTNHVEAIYNLMDYEAIIRKSKESINDVRFRTDCYTIISVGRICSIKHFEKIPQIAADIKFKGGSFRWFIIGGKSENKAYNELKASIINYSVEDEVICLGNKSNPYPYFRAAHLLVSTSSSEACPMIFNEAKILNLPIVTNNFGSSFEFVAEGIDGHICPVEEMADCIFCMMNSNKVYHPSITADFDEQHILSQIDNLLNYENRTSSI